MFTDPQSVTVNTVATDLPRIKVGDQNATYRSADETLQMRVSHQSTGSRNRRMVRLDQTVIAADPLTSVNTSQTAGVYLVIDEPNFGFDDVDLDHLVDALVLWLTSANIAKVLGSES
jgi:hypothetical protein